MPLPNPLSVQTLISLKDDPAVYEAHKKTIKGHNDLIASLGPGVAISPANFLMAGMGTGASLSGVTGTFKRGFVTVNVGTAAIAVNPTLTLRFPKGTFTAQPFAQIVQNGGTGALKFSYTQSILTVVITLIGTPTASTTYTFQFAIRD
jgi:hypothetical protein